MQESPLYLPAEASLVYTRLAPEGGAPFLVPTSYNGQRYYYEVPLAVTSGVTAWRFGFGGSSQTQGTPDSPLIHTIVKGDYQLSSLENRTSHVPNPSNVYTTLGAVGPAVIHGGQPPWGVPRDVNG